MGGRCMTGQTNFQKFGIFPFSGNTEEKWTRPIKDGPLIQEEKGLINGWQPPIIQPNDHDPSAPLLQNWAHNQ